MHSNPLIDESVGQGPAGHAYAHAACIRYQRDSLTTLYGFRSYKLLIGKDRAAGNRAGGGEADRDLGIIQVARRQRRDIVLFNLEITGRQYTARHNGMRGDGNRRGADNSHGHIEMPRGPALAAQLDEQAVLHVLGRTDNRRDWFIAAL